MEIEFRALICSCIVLVSGHVFASTLTDITVDKVKDLPVPSVAGLETISDEGLNGVQGEVLFDISQQVDSNGTQFMRFLLNARVETNLNIGEIKLGDQDGNPLTDDPQIWLEKVSLSGGTGPDSYATLVRPFLEFAMKNYDQPENRELIGLRIGAESSEGILGVGEQDTSQNCLDNGGAACSDYGIREFHGYFEVTGGEATVDIGEVKLAEYLYRRGTGEAFCNGTDASGNCVGDLYVPGSAGDYSFIFNDFLTSAEPNSFQDHLENNLFWAGFCDGGQVGIGPNGEAVCNGGTWEVRADSTLFGGTRPVEHRNAGDTDSTVDAMGNLFGGGDYEYGVRPGQDGELESFFAIPASQAKIFLETGFFQDQDGNLVQSGVLNGQSTTLNLVATGEYAPINYVYPESDDEDITSLPARQEFDAAVAEIEANPSQTRYINVSRFDLAGDEEGEKIVGFFDTQNGEIYVNGYAGLEYADIYFGLDATLLTDHVSIFGRVEGIGIDTRIAEDIRFAHRLNISNTGGQGNGFFISLQSEDIHYPGTLPENVSRKGVWFGLETPVVLGDLGILPQDVYLSDLEYRQIEVGVERGLLQQTNVNLIEALSGANIQTVNINRDLLVTLSDLPLGNTQAPPVNCYGGIDCF